MALQRTNRLRCLHSALYASQLDATILLLFGCLLPPLWSGVCRRAKGTNRADFIDTSNRIVQVPLDVRYTLYLYITVRVHAVVRLRSVAACNTCR